MTKSDPPRRSQDRKARPSRRGDSSARPDPSTLTDGSPAQKHKRGEERRQEAKVYGFNACLTLFEHRPAQIVRGYFSEALAKTCGPVMKYLAAHKKAYHIVSDEELERVTSSTHHEGICLLIRRTPPARIAEWCQMYRDVSPLTVVAVEGVTNPHNLGAIVRTAAHYGVAAMAIDDTSLLQSGAAVRTAEGGAEFVDFVEYHGLIELLRTAKKYRLKVIGTSSHGGTANLFNAVLPERSLILLGEETRGLSRQAMEAADLLLRIPGTGAVESLNVSAAAAVILGEFWRQRHEESAGSTV